MASMKKKRFGRLRRLFSKRRKKQGPDIVADGDGNGNGGDENNQTTLTQKSTLAWTPEDIIGEMHGMPMPDKMRGSVLLIEVNGDDRGWILDFRGKGADSDSDSSIVISRYNIAGFGTKRSNKIPKGPSLTPEEEAANPILNKSLPWLWYKDRKTFSKIETGKLSDTVAFVTGRIGISGQLSNWDPIEPIWNEAKERVTERRKKLQTALGNGNDVANDAEEEVYEDDEEEEEEEIDEEARIIATFKPEVEPTDPRKREFWVRHFGTDALVSSYLFLVSSVAYNIFCLYNLQKLASQKDEIPAYKLAHSIANFFASILFSLGSAYFIKLSYPETTMLMAYHAVTRDPNQMSFIERYFTANEMLIALWLFTAALVIPISIVVLFEMIVLDNIVRAIIDIVTVVLALPFIGVLTIAAMPDCMRMNNGQGSSFFFDGFWVHLLRLNDNSDEDGENGGGGGGQSDNSSRKAFWLKHLGNDGLAGAWIFAFVGVLGGIGVTALVAFKPSGYNWLLFWTTFPFSIGSLLLVRASYPDTMNSSIFFSADEEEPPPNEIEVAENDIGIDEGNEKGEQTPLLVS